MLTRMAALEDPDFGPPLSELGEDMRHKILDFHEEYNVNSKFADIKAKSAKRFDDVANDKYGESSIFIQNDNDEDDEDEDSAINDEKGQRSDLEIRIKEENKRWRDKLKAKPKKFWKWERATSEKEYKYSDDLRRKTRMQLILSDCDGIGPDSRPFK